MYYNKGMKVVVAVSGGVDSVVLLHQLVLAAEHDLVVAHFDHGIRTESVVDARFVEALAKSYSLPFESRREELGQDTSEDKAREKRYEFLYWVADKYQAKLATAHHMDDVVETVALNILRGTGWRGLAGMNDQRIWRPLTRRTKSELTEYALGERLEWVEDETNHQMKYTRNLLRKQLAGMPYLKKRQIYELWHNQLEVREKISREIREADFPVKNRYFMIMIDKATARELLYSYVKEEFDTSLLGNQLEKMAMTIKVGRPGTRWQIGQGITMRLSQTEWYADIGEK